MASSADAALDHLIQQEGRIPPARLQQAREAASLDGIPLEDALSERGDLSPSERRGLLRKREALGRACVICHAITFLLPGQSATRATCEVCGGRLKAGSTRRLARNDLDRRRLRAAAEAGQRPDPAEARRSQRLTRRRSSESGPQRTPRHRPASDSGRARPAAPRRAGVEAGPRVSQRLTRPLNQGARPPAPGAPRASQRLTRPVAKAPPRSGPNARSSAPRRGPGPSAPRPPAPAGPGASPRPSLRRPPAPARQRVGPGPDAQGPGAQGPGAQRSGGQDPGVQGPGAQRPGAQGPGARRPAGPGPTLQPASVRRPTVQRPSAQAAGSNLRQAQRGPEVMPPRAGAPLPVDVARTVKEAFDASKQELLARVRREAHEEVQRTLQRLGDDVESRLARVPEQVAAALERGPAAEALAARLEEARQRPEPQPLDLDPELVAAALSAAAPRELEGVALGLLGSEALRAPLAALDERIEAQQRALEEAAAAPAPAAEAPSVDAGQLSELGERLAALSREQRAVAETLRAEAEAHARDAAREALSRIHSRGVAGLVEEALAKVLREREELSERLSSSTRRLDALERRLEASSLRSVPAARRWLALQRALRPAALLSIVLLAPVLVAMAFAPAVHEARVNLGVSEGEFRGPHDHLLALAGNPAILNQVADQSGVQGERGPGEWLLGVEPEPAARLGARIASVRGSQSDYLIVHARGVSRSQARAAAEALAQQVIRRAAQSEANLGVLGQTETRRLQSLLWLLPGSLVALATLSLLLCWARELRRRGFTDGREASALLDLPLLLTLEGQRR